ncbi:MAG: DUF3783 domain-containing protein [Peptoniphilaceae bacterium]|nr:DUF3783 domain-containing protein [Peptoniphilaceae bacterium]
MSKILYYNPIDLDKYERIKKIAANRGIEIIEVGKDHINSKVGYLLGLDGFDSEEADITYEDAFDFDFALFDDFTNEELFGLIDELRENQAAVSHKAGVTENNIKWTLGELLTENDKEAKAMGLINKINALVEKNAAYKEKYGEDPKIKGIIDEINAYFASAEIFELDLAKGLYLRLLDETLRVEKEHE